MMTDAGENVNSPLHLIYITEIYAIYFVKKFAERTFWPIFAVVLHHAARKEKSRRQMWKSNK